MVAQSSPPKLIRKPERGGPHAAAHIYFARLEKLVRGTTQGPDSISEPSSTYYWNVTIYGADVYLDNELRMHSTAISRL